MWVVIYGACGAAELSLAYTSGISFSGGVKEENTSWGGVYVLWKQIDEKTTVQVYLSFMKSNAPFLTPDSFQVSPDFTGYA